MIKTLILFFLSKKPTHGYEIQKFIQLNHLDSWTKIQSGSIYYALNKLEQNGIISLLNSEKSNGKEKKIYQITEKGLEELHTTILEELDKNLYDTGSDKFILYPILSGIEKDIIIKVINDHLLKLQNNIKEIKKG